MTRKLINKILSLRELVDKPPVLIDIGASGQLHKPWKNIGKYSICIAFDADERKFKFVREEVGKFKKLLIYNGIVTASENTQTDFYLTKSPYCSSILEPNSEALKNWAFSDKFEVTKKVKMNSYSLNSVLSEAKIDYVDWFKTDSQGIDLRLFASLPDGVRNNILVAEFEPGILDSYHGEDKLFQLMEFMDGKNFWMSDIKIKGTAIIPSDKLIALAKNEKIRKMLQFSMKNSPGWAEVTYMNSFKNHFEKRDFLLGWIFAAINKHYGFALTLAEEGYLKFGDKIFLEMKSHSVKQMKLGICKLKFIPALLRRSRL